MDQAQKIKMYQVNPRYFKDTSNNGIGDLKGFIQKFDYFTFLGINSIHLVDFLSTESIIYNEVHDYKKVASELGTLDDVKQLIALAKKQKISLFIEINLGSVSESNIFFNELQSSHKSKKSFVQTSDKVPKIKIFQESIKMNPVGYVAQNLKTKDFKLNWDSENTLYKFIDVVKYWHSLGIDGFIFKNFELLTSPMNYISKSFMEKETLLMLKRFYEQVKSISRRIILTGKSELIDLEAGERLTKGEFRIFDFFLNEKLVFLGTKNENVDLIGKFNPQDLINKLELIAKFKNTIFTFGSPKVGRMISRWGTNGEFHAEAAKSFALALLLNTSHWSIYYGDEIGMKNIGALSFDKYSNQKHEENNLYYVDSKFSKTKFVNAQLLQNSLNSSTAMAWYSGFNGGFSLAKETFCPISDGIKHINVQTEFADKFSILNFYKKMIHMTTKQSSLYHMMSDGKFEISALDKKVLKVSVADYKNEIIALVNLSKNQIKVPNSLRRGKVILASYEQRNYDEIPAILDSFESILISRWTDDYTKSYTQFHATNEATYYGNVSEESKTIAIEQDIKKQLREIRTIETKTKEESAMMKEASLKLQNLEEKNLTKK